MDEESYYVFPWMNGEAFESLAELEMAYGDNCVDCAIADIAELWAHRSGTSSPCVGDWSPSTFSLDDAIREWAGSQHRLPDDAGLYITGFRSWVEHKLSESSEFDDFVWNRFVEFSIETMDYLRKNVRLTSGQDVLYDDKMMYKFRDRICSLPYYVRISVPPMPNDTEERLAKAVSNAMRPKRQKARFRLSKSMFPTPQHADEGISEAIAQAQSKSAQKKQEKAKHALRDGCATGLTSDGDAQREQLSLSQDSKGDARD